MLILHLDIDDRGRAFFRGEAPSESDGVPGPVRTSALLRAVREIVWYPDGFTEAGGGRLLPEPRNLLMFLSDVRGRTFKKGIFLAEDVLCAAKTFRAAAAAVAEGQILPSLAREADGSYRAYWRAVCTSNGPFFDFIVDALARRAGWTAVETESPKHETVHDAWLGALRSESGVLHWPDAADAEMFCRDLDVWSAPLVTSTADRAALTFTLVPPTASENPWRLELAASPQTRLGLISLGQAASVFPPLRTLRNGAAELERAEADAFLRTGAIALINAGYAVNLPEGIMGEHLSAEGDLTPEETTPGGTGTPSERVAAKLTIHVDGEIVSEAEIEFLLEQNSPLVFFRNRWIEVDRNILKEALRALQSAKTKKLSVHEAVSFAFGFARAGRLRIAHVKAHGWLRGLLNELRGESCFKLLPPPEGLKGTLRDYQLRGVSWLAFLTKWGFGPCLADDMGLGKTIQTIAYLLGRPASPVPALIVAPVTVTTNWTREFARFAPKMKVYLHQGPLRRIGSSFDLACRAADVVVTGYALLVKDFRLFAETSFSALVLDEAQNIKNAETRAARAAAALDIPVRIALTGTPLENSVADLWALEAFLNPGLLGDRKEFLDTFERPIAENAHDGASTRLKHVLEPFLLRRLKSDPGILSELGEKREIREYCSLDTVQRRRYEDALASFRLDAEAGAASRGRVLALLTELKEICDAPELSDPLPATPDRSISGGKIDRLDELLTSIFETGGSALIFTQYARMGKLLRAHLQEVFGRRFPFLHGALTPSAREAEIDAFNADPEPNAFILSLKAGGYGLNLTRATHVIHYDRWWNPAVENQATDRAHRMGQTQTVFVHTFICAGTLEDRIDALLESKRFLADKLVASGESFLMKMSAREIEDLVRLEDSHEQA